MKKMKSTLRVLDVFVVVAFMTVAFMSTARADYSGSLTGNGGGITASQGWNSTNTVFSWTVEDVGNQEGSILWKYTYRLIVPEKDISHIIIEVSPDAAQADFSAGLFGNYSAANGNPGMPAAMKGLKFPESGGTGVTDYTFSFTTTRAPVWGDFYAKDGKTGGVDVTAWNEGFLKDDPTAAASNGSIDNHILRPDTKSVYVPEPTTLMLLGLGLVGLAGVGRKFKK